MSTLLAFEKKATIRCAVVLFFSVFMFGLVTLKILVYSLSLLITFNLFFSINININAAVSYMLYLDVLLDAVSIVCKYSTTDYIKIITSVAQQHFDVDYCQKISTMCSLICSYFKYAPYRHIAT